MLQLDFHDPVSRRFLRQLRRQLFVTTPTSMINRLTGAETWTDPITAIGSGWSLPSGTTVNGAAIPGSSAPVSVAAGTTTLTLMAALHAGKVVLVQPSGGLAITPPAATGTGNVYRIVVGTTVAGGNLTVDAKAGNASDVFAGSCIGVLSGGVTTTTYPTAANSNLITMSGTTTGGVAGTEIVMTDVATNLWIVRILNLQTSTGATPFSNH